VVGHWNEIAKGVLPASTSTADAALLFARLNTATWDASIAAYRQKYGEGWSPEAALHAKGS
jgi:hypothetical protein